MNFAMKQAALFSVLAALSLLSLLALDGGVKAIVCAVGFTAVANIWLAANWVVRKSDQ